MIGSRGENLIFVISQPRSGSTMLQYMLAGHPAIHTTSEPWLMLPLLHLDHAERGQAVYDGRIAGDAIRGFLESIPDGVEVYREALRQFATHLYKASLANSKKTHFLDKTPRYYLILPQLFELFPEARFILLVRNPLSVLVSIVETWVVKKTWLSLYNYRTDLMKAPGLLAEAEPVLGRQGILVRYEDLLDDTANTLARLQCFLQLDNVVDLSIYNPSLGQDWEMGDTKVKQFNTADPSGSTRWIEKLRHPQIWRLASDYLAELDAATLATLGYDKELLEAIVSDHRPPRHKRMVTVSLKWLVSKPIDRRVRVEFYRMRLLRLLDSS